MSEQEDYDGACWAQQEQNERRRAEDAALIRHALLLTASRAELEDFIRETEAFHKRIAAPAVNEQEIEPCHS